LHVGFNATSLAVPDEHPLFKDPSLGPVLGCVTAAALLAGILGFIGRSSASADRARQVDLAADPGLGETPS
jgi:hypothetical protein